MIVGSEHSFKRLYVMSQHRAHVGIGNCGVPSQHKVLQPAQLMRYRHMVEADSKSDVSQLRLMLIKAIRMQQANRQAALTGIKQPLEDGFCLCLVQWLQHCAVCIDPFIDLDHPAVQRFRPDDMQRKNVRPRLVANDQCIGHALCGDEYWRFTPMLQQCVGCHRSAHANGIDTRIRMIVQRAAHGFGRGVLVLRRVLRQQFAYGKPAVRITCDDVGKRPAPINPELPVLSHAEFPFESPHCRANGLPHGRSCVLPQ